eukprot:scaffold564600_cov51-Prasinocladus_malaysianus.AAC.1
MSVHENECGGCTGDGRFHGVILTQCDFCAVYPNMESRSMEVTVNYVNKKIGVDLPPQTIASLLSKMQLQGSVLPGGKAVGVKVASLTQLLSCSCT